MLVEGENDFTRQSGSDLCPLRSSHYRGFRPDYAAGRQRMVYPLWIYVANPTGKRFSRFVQCCGRAKARNASNGVVGDFPLETKCGQLSSLAAGTSATVSGIT